jgi:hypothetical protein
MGLGVRKMTRRPPRRCQTMPVEGEEDDAELRLRTEMATGEVEGHEFMVSLNIDSGAVYVEFPDADTRVAYRTGDFVEDAFEVAFTDKDRVCLDAESVESVLELLEEVMQAGKRTLSHDEVRPSSHMMATKGRDAYRELVQAHPDYDLSTDEGEDDD